MSICRPTLFVFLALAVGGAAAAPGPRAPAAAIASAHPLATAAGHEVLAEGGNAFDAAVALTAALAVVEPYSSGLGGGGFWLLHRAADGHEVMVDGRERAPLAAHRDLYLDANGEVIPRASIDGPLAAGIPGVPAALGHLAARYGRLPLARSLAPAIRLAREGFEIDEVYRRLAGFRLKALQDSPAAASQFLVAGEVPGPGQRLRQPDLARVLERIAEQGPDGFYRGPLAESLVAGVRAAGGIWSARDLEEYRVVEREPVRGRFGAVRITSAAPPSSGGAALVQILNVFAATEPPPAGDTRTHLLVEAMRRAYRDRAIHLGDPDFVQVPLHRLLSPDYAAGLAVGIARARATPSEALGGPAGEDEGPHTTHFSVLDREGNRVAATLSINYPFGSGFVPAGTGVLLNDEMDDFSARPGTPNVYGLVGGEANAIAPGKRMLSSMSPTFLDDGRRLAVVGTPGGSRIITMVVLAALEFAAGGGALDLVRRARIHHQYLPDEIQYEPGALSASQRAALEERGHRLREQERAWGNMQAVVWDRAAGRVEAASDERGIGAALVR